MWVQAQRQLLRHSAAVFLNRNYPSSLRVRPNNNPSLCSSSSHKTWTCIAQLSHQDLIVTTETPVQLFSSSIPSILGAAGDSTAFQTASTILLTAAFTLFLFRSFRRPAKRVKQMRIRSSEATETSLKIKRASKSPPSPDQALIGALIAAAFGVALYKFTTTIEYTLNHQTLSDNYSVRQITITIRTIINGLCYLATFVFGFNSLGLFLYSGQLAMNSFVEVPRVNSTDSNLADSENTTTAEDQSSDKLQ